MYENEQTSLYKDIIKKESFTEVIKTEILNGMSPSIKELIDILAPQDRDERRNWERAEIYSKDVAYLKETQKKDFHPHAVFTAEKLEVFANKQSIHKLILIPNPETLPWQRLDLDTIDNAGLIKVISFRINNPICKNKEFKNLFLEIGALRNHYEGHLDDKTVKATTFEHALRILSTLKTKTSEAIASLNKGNYPQKEACITVFEKMMSLFEQIEEVLLEMDTCKITKDSSQRYNAKDLFPYHVFLAYPNVSNDSFRRFCDGNMRTYCELSNKRLYTDKGTLDWLQHLISSGTDTQRNEAKQITKDVFSYLHKHSLITVLENTSDDENFALKKSRFIEEIQKLKLNICVITDDVELADKIWKLNDHGQGENSIVAVKILDKETVVPFYISETPIAFEEKDSRNKPLNILIPQQGDAVVFGDKHSGTAYRLGKAVKDGGEGTIYPGVGGKVFKIYKKHRHSAYTISKLEEMVANQPSLSDKICWPEQLIYEPSDKRTIVGYSMKNVMASGNEAYTLDVFISAISEFSEKWNFGRDFLVRVCIKTVENFAQLHKSGILMGDVNLGNIMVDKDCNVFFIDTDSYQYKDYLCNVCMLEFTSPKVYKTKKSLSKVKRTLDDEYFAIACLIYRILFLGALPFPSNNSISDNIQNYEFKFSEKYDVSETDKKIWFNTTLDIRQAFFNAFTKGEYPDDSLWKDLLNEMFDLQTEGRLSSELFPSEYVAVTKKESPVKFTKTKCTNCNRVFESVNSESNPERLCSVCQETREDNQKNIYRVTCSACKQTFTANAWDSRGMNTDNCLCPDCAGKSAVPEKDYKSLDKLQKIYGDILKNMACDEEVPYI